MSTATNSVRLWPEGSANDADSQFGRPRLDVFAPAGHGPGDGRAAMIVCPGGGYAGLAPHEGAPFAELFAAAGMVGMVCFYRVAPNRWPAGYADLARAVRLVRANAEAWGIDPQRVGVMGFSAGGHNAATVATQPAVHVDGDDDLADAFDARPDRLALGYPVISIGAYGHRGSGESLFGPEVTQEQRQAVSADLHVSEATPPTFIFHTVDDPAVPIEGSMRFALACRRANVPVELHAYERGPHGVGLARDEPRLAGWSDLLLHWLAAAGWAERGAG